MITFIFFIETLISVNFLTCILNEVSGQKDAAEMF